MAEESLEDGHEDVENRQEKAAESNKLLGYLKSQEHQLNADSVLEEIGIQQQLLASV